MANRNNRQTAAAQESAPQVDPAPEADLPKDRDSTLTQTADAQPKEREGEPGVDYAVPGADPSNVEKITVKTSGEFTLQDPWTGKTIRKGEKTEVVVTTFIRDRLENGDLVKA